MLSGANATTLDQARNERWKATALVIWTLLVPERSLTIPTMVSPARLTARTTDNGVDRQPDLSCPYEKVRTGWTSERAE